MTPSLNNGLFLRETNYVAGSHLDSYHLINMVKDTKPDDMGIIDLWCMMKKVDMPLYSMASLSGKNVSLVEDANGRWSWKIPVTNDLPFIVEDLDSSNTTKGIDGQTFQIKCSRREFGKGELITFDKFSGAELYIVPHADIIEAADHTIYTVQLVNNDSVAYLDNAYLASGTQVFRVTSVRGEYGQEFADMRVEAGFREFFNYLPSGSAHVHYTISSRAALMLQGGLNADGTIPVMEIWKNQDKNLDPSVTDLRSMAEIMGPEYIKSSVSNGTMSKTYLSKMDTRHVAKVGKDIETYLMWGKGGTVRQDGADDIRMSAGLWKQLDSGYLRLFNKANLSLALFRNELYNFYNGKVEINDAKPNRKLRVRTGIAGAQIMNTLIAKESAGLGWVINGDKSGTNVVTGDAMSLGYGFNFSSIIIPYYAELTFEVSPGLDPAITNSIENPIIDGFPLSSYSFIIDDINESADNIFLKKAKYDPGFRWWYENGTMDYMGKASGFQSSGRFNGYQVFMEQMHMGLWVKDPSKILKICMINPITGGHV